MNQYLNNLNEEERFLGLTEYAKENKVPIIFFDALLLIKSYLRNLKAFKESIYVLEIGTAIAYSALQFASVDASIHIDTIERDPKMIELANENLKQFDEFNQITLFPEDALTINLKQLRKNYDLIFIDAGKAQSQKFFEKFETLLNPKGLIITDNILFHGLVEDPSSASPRLKPLVKRIDKYNCWLSKLTHYHTTFLEIGDGLAISQKVNNEAISGNSK